MMWFFLDSRSTVRSSGGMDSAQIAPCSLVVVISSVALALSIHPSIQTPPMTYHDSTSTQWRSFRSPVDSFILTRHTTEDPARHPSQILSGDVIGPPPLVHLARPIDKGLESEIYVSKIEVRNGEMEIAGHLVFTSCVRDVGG